MPKKAKKPEPKPQMVMGFGPPIKKVMPAPLYIAGLYAYLCDVCYVEWSQKEMEQTIKCPDCGKLLHRDETFDEYRKLGTRPTPEVVAEVA